MDADRYITKIDLKKINENPLISELLEKKRLLKTELNDLIKDKEDLKNNTKVKIIKKQIIDIIKEIRECRKIISERNGYG